MSAKINGAALKSDAEKIQAAKVKALADHKATLKLDEKDIVDYKAVTNKTANEK